MAKVANAMTTYQAKGNREDLADRIYNIDPFDTPGVSMIGRRNVKNRTFDWQTENLPAVDLNNAQEEGFELVRSAGCADCSSDQPHADLEARCDRLGFAGGV